MNYAQYWLPAIIATVVCFTPKLKYVATMFSTITHELGHAFVILPFGGRISGIRLRANGEGDATVRLPAYPFPFSWMLRILNLFAGYSAPIYVGLILSAMSIAGAGWWPLVIMLGIPSLILIPFIRNLFGLLVTGCFTLLNATVVAFGTDSLLHAYALTVGLMLFIAGIRDVLDATRWVFKRQLDSSDFHLAAEEMGFTPRVWVIIFWVCSIALATGLGYGAHAMLTS